MKVRDDIRVVQVPETTPLRPVSTNIYLVGRASLTMIDSGVREDRYSQAIFKELVALGRRRSVSQCAITHSHPDHRGGLPWVLAAAGPKLFAHPGAITIAASEVAAERFTPLDDGSTLETDSARFEVHHTPGHSADSICFFDRERRILFTGDTILGMGTTVVKDLPDYMASLNRLLALEPGTICPGHGPILDDGAKVIAGYIAHRNQREQQILDALRRGPQTVARLVSRIYAGVDKRLHKPARMNVRQHLAKLEREGRVRAEGPGYRARFELTG
ncbi:MAG: MBL fold metallo-hydrolase [Dehalococcoidia bacterium]|nr:MBL fold metallo-hydrolase [Dehalococcoidia bacterium]